MKPTTEEFRPNPGLKGLRPECFRCGRTEWIWELRGSDSWKRCTGCGRRVLVGGK